MDEAKIKEAFETGIKEVSECIGKRFYDRRGREMARQYITGLMSTAERKNGWQLSEALGQNTPYAVQQFLYRGNWNADDLRNDLRDYIQAQLGDESSVLVVDETGFLKKGKKSAGVARQYSGTAGRIENCQVGVFLAYSSPKGHALIDRQLYLPKEWMDDCQRCEDAKIPEETAFATKPNMALSMLKSAYEANVSFSWVTADSIYGDFTDIGMWLESISKGYVMAVSGKAYFWRGFRQHRVSTILKSLPEEGHPDWQRLSAGIGTKGERLYDWLLVPVNDPPKKGWKRSLLIRKCISKPDEIRAFACLYPEDASLDTLVSIAGTRWTVEQCFGEAKGEVGLDHYEVRSYAGWYKHITLSCWALALLTVLKMRATGTAFQEAIMVEMPDNADGLKKGRNF
jgi:SRSO17 transposase